MAYAPDHDALNAIAASQAGYFTTAQARECGFSDQLIQSHLKTGNFERVLRGVYRHRVIPPGEHGDLVVYWLWSGGEGVFSHQTVLSLLRLSDVLPARTHLTLPAARRARPPSKVPLGLVPHYADVPPAEREWFGPVPVTSPYRAIVDCLEAGESDAILTQAVDDAEARGLLDGRQVEYIRARIVIRRHRG